jgi:radical SAM superfamily enzyme YgiQ (UPF0313 family)
MTNTKAKIILVNPILSYDKNCHKKNSSAYPYPGLMIIASILDREGYLVRLIDANLYSVGEFIEKLILELNDNVVFVGFSLMTMNVSWAYDVIKSIKRKNGKITIVVGGIHPTLFPDEMIEDDLIDIVVINEATSTIALLTDTLLKGSDLGKVPGIYFKRNGKIIKNTPNLDLDSFSYVPFINFSLIQHEEYAKDNCLSSFPYFPKKEYRVYPIQTSFGCAFKCAFCINSMYRRRYRMRSAEEIVDRIEFLIKEYNANFIAFYDEEFFISKKRLLRFVELVEEKKLKFLWRTSLRVTNFRDDYLNDELLHRLEKIGFLSAVMGAESGSQRVLNLIKKQITPEQTINAVKALSKTKIVPKISFMVGIPGETEDEILGTYRLAIKLKKIMLKAKSKGEIQVLSFRLYPGSLLYNKATSDYGHKGIHKLKELVMVDGSNLEKGWGFPVGNRKYIKNPKRFDLMQFYYNTFIWPYHERKGVLRHLSVKLAMLRFQLNFFGLSFFIKTIMGMRKGMREILKCLVRRKK